MQPIEHLVVKTSWTRLSDGTLKSSFGDILRVTPLLSCFRENWLWLTDSRSMPLLSSFIDPARIVFTESGLGEFRFSENLKTYYLDNHDTVALAAQANGSPLAPRLRRDLKVPDSYVPSQSEGSWQESLIRASGYSWHGQDYAIARVRSAVEYEVGLNWRTPPEWTSKAWPRQNWNLLSQLLTEKAGVSWQPETDDLTKYIQWVDSCKVIISNDSLGLHLASALRKKVVSLMGPTDNREFGYGRLHALRPRPRPCMPCFAPECRLRPHCLEEIAPEEVASAALAWLAEL